MRRLLAVTALALCILAVPSPAAAYIYWVNYTSSIGRANLDGTGVLKSFITPTWDIDGLAVDSNHLYWPNHNFMVGNAIARADVGGGNVDEVFIPGAQANLGVAVDSSYVYWGRGGGAIGRASISGGGGNPYWFSQAGLDGAYGLAVDGGHLYWTGSCGYYCDVGRAGIDGSSPDQGFINTNGFKPQIAVDGAHIYWANYAYNYIGRANLDGSGVNTMFIAAITPYGVAVDGQHIYWSNYSANKIGRANLDGSGVDQSFITGVTNPTFLAVDSRVPATAPTSTGAPQITGTAAVGGTLMCSDGSWSGSPAPTLFRQWLRDGVAILGATGGSTYMVSLADAGHSLSCRVTAQNSIGSANATSAAVVIAAAPANTSPPRIAGAPKVGSTLRCTNGSWSGGNSMTFTRRWLRDGLPIPRATATTYVVKPADRGHALRCLVSATNGSGQAQATSAAVRVK